MWGVYGILQTPDPSEWTISDEGLISYPKRGDVVYSITDLDNTGNSDTLKLVSFESQNVVINGLLRIPGSDTKVPAIVLLPGAGVTKENEQGLASIISRFLFIWCRVFNECMIKTILPPAQERGVALHTHRIFNCFQRI